MGQKVHPIGFRLAVTKDWESKWFAAPKDYGTQLHQDLKIRKYLDSRLQKGAVSRVVIERAWNSVRLTLHTSRPGLIIGKRGAEIEVMTDHISKMLCHGSQVKIDIHEIRQPELDAQWIASQVATQLERRVNFRRAMKRSIQCAMDFGADGIRIRISGRLQGGDIARAESYRQGKVPLQTLRVPIQYGFTEAETVWGMIGVKVWLNKKEETESKGGPGQRRNAGGGGGGRGGRGPGGGGPRGQGGGGGGPRGQGGGGPRGQGGGLRGGGGGYRGQGGGPRGQGQGGGPRDQGGGPRDQGGGPRGSEGGGPRGSEGGERAPAAGDTRVPGGESTKGTE